MGKKQKGLEELFEIPGIKFEPEKQERPTKVRIFGRDYAISYIPEYMGFKDCGLTDNNNLLITIK